MNRFSFLTFVNIIVVSILLFFIIKISQLKFGMMYLLILQKDKIGNTGIEKSMEELIIEMNFIIFLVFLMLDVVLLSISIIHKHQMKGIKNRIQLYIIFLINFAITVVQYNEVLVINSLAVLFLLSSKGEVSIVKGKYDTMLVNQFELVLVIFSLIIFNIVLNYIFLKLNKNKLPAISGTQNFVYHIMILASKIQFIFLFERLLDHALSYQYFENLEIYQNLLNVVLFFLFIYIGWSSDYSVHINTLSNKIYSRIKAKYSKFISIQLIIQLLNYITILFAGLIIYLLSNPFEEYTISMKISLFSIIEATAIVWIGMAIATIHKNKVNSEDIKLKLLYFDFSIYNLIRAIKIFLKLIFIFYLLISIIFVSTIFENQYTKSINDSEEGVTSVYIFDIISLDDINMEGKLYYLSELNFEGRTNDNSEVRLSFTSILFFNYDSQSHQINIEDCIDVKQILTTIDKIPISKNDGQFTLISTLNEINVLQFVLNASATEYSDFDIGLGNRITEEDQEYCRLETLPSGIVISLNDVLHE